MAVGISVPSWGARVESGWNRIAVRSGASRRWPTRAGSRSSRLVITTSFLCPLTTRPQGVSRAQLPGNDLVVAPVIRARRHPRPRRAAASGARRNHVPGR